LLLSLYAASFSVVTVDGMLEANAPGMKALPFRFLAGLLGITLDKMKHFVDSAKAPCPAGKGFRGIGEGKLSTKR
jgi:hypothetical protein